MSACVACRAAHGCSLTAVCLRPCPCGSLYARARVCVCVCVWWWWWWWWAVGGDLVGAHTGVTLLNRLDGDQVLSPVETLMEYDLRPGKAAIAYMNAQLGL